MISIELIERQPNQLFIDRLLQVLCKRERDLFRGGAAVTPSPDQRRSLIKAMSQITLQIVNEGFVWKLLNDETLFSRARLGLAIGTH